MLFRSCIWGDVEQVQRGLSRARGVWNECSWGKVKRVEGEWGRAGRGRMGVAEVELTGRRVG